MVLECPLLSVYNASSKDLSEITAEGLIARMVDEPTIGSYCTIGGKCHNYSNIMFQGIMMFLL